MKIRTKESLGTVEGKTVVVPPGIYELVYALQMPWMRDGFLFTIPFEKNDIFIGKTIFRLLEKSGIIEILTDERSHKMTEIDSLGLTAISQEGQGEKTDLTEIVLINDSKEILPETLPGVSNFYGSEEGNPFF